MKTTLLIILCLSGTLHAQELKQNCNSSMQVKNYFSLYLNKYAFVSEKSKVIENKSQKVNYTVIEYTDKETNLPLVYEFANDLCVSTGISVPKKEKEGTVKMLNDMYGKSVREGKILVWYTSNRDRKICLETLKDRYRLSFLTKKCN